MTVLGGAVHVTVTGGAVQVTVTGGAVHVTVTGAGQVICAGGGDIGGGDGEGAGICE